MLVPAEYQLAAAILVIYLLDCVALLYVNEGIVERNRVGWRITFGSSQPWIAGKRIALLNPFTPQLPTWRAAWRMREVLDAHEVTGTVADHLQRQANALRKLQPYLWCVCLLVLIALPLALGLRNTLGFLGVALLAWLAVWALVIRLWFLRSAIDLSIGGFVLAAFECLVCPPNAANLTRKLSMRQAINTDLVAIAGMLSTCEKDEVLVHIDRDVAARQILLETETPEYARTVLYRTALDLARARVADPQTEETQA